MAKPRYTEFQGDDPQSDDSLDDNLWGAIRLERSWWREHCWSDPDGTAPGAEISSEETPRQRDLSVATSGAIMRTFNDPSFEMSTLNLDKSSSKEGSLVEWPSKMMSPKNLVQF